MTAYSNKMKPPLYLFRQKAERLAKNAARASRMIDEASIKAERTRGTMAGAAEGLQTLIRLARAYISGRYRELPWTALITTLAALVYFVNPLDLVPDFVIGFGLLDDLTVIAFAVNGLRAELERFRAWETAADG